MTNIEQKIEECLADLEKGFFESRRLIDSGTLKNGEAYQAHVYVTNMYSDFIEEEEDGKNKV